MTAAGRARARARIGAAATALAVLACGCSPGGTGETGDGGAPGPEAEAAGILATPEPAPDFTLRRLGGGQPVSLASLRGKTVVLDFWATWCPPCEFQVPELNRFYDAHRSDSDVEVFGISIDTEGDAVVAAWVAEQGVRYPILMGGEALAREYGALGFPTTFVVGPDGLLRAQHVGLIETVTLEAALAEARGDGTS